jgi:hypothetical protein
MVGRLGVRRSEAIVCFVEVEGAEGPVDAEGVGTFIAVLSMLILILPCVASLLGNDNVSGLEVGGYDCIAASVLLLKDADGSFSVASGLMWEPSIPANKLKPASPVVK